MLCWLDSMKEEYAKVGTARSKLRDGYVVRV
jgi:hypothetical protein